MNQTELIDRALDNLHKSLCNNAGGAALEAANLVLAVFEEAELIGGKERHLRSLALNTCPGHVDGGRVWCAYCGNIEQRTTDGLEAGDALPTSELRTSRGAGDCPECAGEGGDCPECEGSGKA